MIACIIGGGPSAKDLDTEQLPGLVIGVNDAGLLKPCHAWFTLDHNYARAARERITRLPSSTELHICTYHKNFHHFEGWRVQLWRRVAQAMPMLDGATLSSGPGTTPGCSGYVAINLAAALGAERIYLYGYDFHQPYSYFFDDKPFPRKAVREVVDSFTRVARHYERAGIEVINCNPNSAIKAFKHHEVTHAA